jgi:hypothetical protein
MKTIKQIMKPENGIEEAIVSHPDFIEGCNYGKPRPGHPEGKVFFHIREVLDNVDKFYLNDPDRSDLRLIALTHDTFKHKVIRSKPKTGDNHHGTIARVFAQQFIHDHKVLSVIERHDSAYNAWGKGARHDKWYKAERLSTELIHGLLTDGGLGLYIKFYKCDNLTGDKEQDNYEWFLTLIK